MPAHPAKATLRNLSTPSTMQLTGLLLSALRPQTSVPQILSISQQSRTQRLRYQALLQANQWQELAEICHSDLRQAGGEALAVIAGVRDLRLRRSDVHAALKEMQRMIASTRKRNSNVTQLDAPARRKLRETHKLLTENIFQKNYGRFALAAAHDLLRLQSAALQRLMEAEVHQATLAEESANLDRLSKMFGYALPVKDLARVLSRYRVALGQHQRRVYLSALGERASLPSALNNLSLWVVRNIRGLLGVQTALTLLLKHVDVQRASTNARTLNVLAVDAGMLLREAVASHLAASVGFFAVNRVPLRYDAVEVLFRPSTIPLHGRLEIGKRTSVRRLGRLADGLLVRIEGILTRAEFIEAGPKTKKSYFLGTLRDDAGGVIQLVASSNLLLHGLREGCHLRVSGLWLKKGSTLYRQKHVELARLNIDEVYGPDIWKMAFLNLASRYFTMWPENYHVAYQLIPGKPSDKGSAPFSTLGVCDQEQENVNQAKASLAKAESHVASHTLLVTVAAAAVIAVCGGTAGLGCLAALAVWLAEANELSDAFNEVDAAEQALSDATNALNDCLGLHATGDIDPPEWPEDDGLDIEDSDFAEQEDSIESMFESSLDSGSLPASLPGSLPDSVVEEGYDV